MKSKAGSRGGIQKKRAGTKTDGDGDLDMDSAARRANKPTAGAGGAQPRSTRSSARNPRGTSKAAQTAIKHITNGGSKGRGKAQNSAGLSYLRIRGLKQSKASSNQDGGVSDLLSFLERKASSFSTDRQKRNIMIKKVCFAIDEVSGCIELPQQLPQAAICSFAVNNICRDEFTLAWCHLRQQAAPNFNNPHPYHVLT